MRAILMGSVAVLALSGVALAETGDQWPRYPHSYDGGFRYENGAVYRAPAQAAANVWTDDFVAFGASKAATSADAGGQHPIDAKELDRIRARNTAYRYGVHRRIANSGGCNADFLPVEYAAACWHSGKSANPTGGPVGESLGGDGGVSGGDAESGGGGPK